MKRIATLAILVLIPVVVLAAGSPAAAPPDPQIAQLKKQLRTANAKAADLQDQVDAQNDLLADQAAQLARLRFRLANPPDPLDQITARNPDGLWAAMVAIWRSSSTLEQGALCGYDKSSTSPADEGLTLTSYTFYRWQGC